MMYPKPKLAINALLLLSGLAGSAVAENEKKTQFRGVSSVKPEVRELQETFDSLKQQLEQFSSGVTSDAAGTGMYEASVVATFEALGGLFDKIEGSICALASGLDNIELHDKTQSAGKHRHKYYASHDHKVTGGDHHHTFHDASHAHKFHFDHKHPFEHTHPGFGFEGCDLKCDIKCGDTHYYGYDGEEHDYGYGYGMVTKGGDHTGSPNPKSGETEYATISGKTESSDIGHATAEYKKIKSYTSYKGEHKHDMKLKYVEKVLNDIGEEAKEELMSNCTIEPDEYSYYSDSYDVDGDVDDVDGDYEDFPEGDDVDGVGGDYEDFSEGDDGGDV